MICISRKQLASVSLGIDIVETLALIPDVTFVLPSNHNSPWRDWYNVCDGNRSLRAARAGQPPHFCPNS